MLISVYNESIDRWEIKEYNTLTVEEKIRNEQFQAELEELSKLNIKVPFLKLLQIQMDNVSRETNTFSKKLLDQRYTSINVNAALHALEHGQNPYVLIEQLLQQLDNVQKEYSKLLEHVGSLER